jgi:hypothetical protein
MIPFTFLSASFRSALEQDASRAYVMYAPAMLRAVMAIAEHPACTKDLACLTRAR